MRNARTVTDLDSAFHKRVVALCISYEQERARINGEVAE